MGKLLNAAHWLLLVGSPKPDTRLPAMELPIRHLARLVPPGSFGRNVGVLALGTAVGQLAVLLAAPLLTRLYSPAEFGTLGIFVSLVAIIQVVSALGYQKAIPLPKEDVDSQALLAVSMLFVLATVALVTVLSVCYGTIVLRWMNAPNLLGCLWLVSVAVALTQFYEILSQWTIRHKDFGTLSRTKISQGVGMATLQVGLGVAGIGSLGLILGDILGRSLGIASMLCKLCTSDHVTVSQLRLKKLTSMMWRYRQFPIVQSPYMLVNQVGINSPTLLIAMFYSPAVAGAYLLAQKVVQTPLLVINRSVARVYLGEAAELARERPQELRRLVHRTFRSLFLIAVVPITVVAVSGPLVFGFVFGEGWRAAGVFTAILGLPLLLQFAIAPLMQTLVVTERQPLLLAWGVLRFVLVTAAIALAHLLSLPAAYAVLFLGVALTLAYVSGFCLLHLFVHPATTPDTESLSATSTRVCNSTKYDDLNALGRSRRIS